MWRQDKGDNFEATMGEYDGAKVCELTDIYMLHVIGKKYSLKNFGLYKDDGLAIFKNTKNKKTITFFKQKGLQIIIECNLKAINY